MIIIGAKEYGSTQYIKSIIKSQKNIKFVSSLDYIRNCVSNNKKNIFVITGTSIGYYIDKKLLFYAKKNNIKSISILDSWGNYAERFKHKNKLIVGDYIIVNDKENLNQLKKIGIDNSKIFIGGNPILEEYSKKKIKKIPLYYWKKINNINKNKKIIIFISEPFKENYNNHKKKYLFDEFTALNDIIEKLNNDSHLIIKLHPSENKNKYNKYINNQISIAHNLNIYQLYNLPVIIIGMTSFILIEISFFNSNVISYIPFGIKKFVKKNSFTIRSISSIDMLSQILKSKKITNNKFVNNQFKESKQKIQFFINDKFK